jgi:hypothetical protein
MSARKFRNPKDRNGLRLISIFRAACEPPPDVLFPVRDRIARIWEDRNAATAMKKAGTNHQAIAAPLTAPFASPAHIFDSPPSSAAISPFVDSNV